MGKHLDSIRNRLGLLPRQADRLTPQEIVDLGLGDQENWNRIAELGAWIALMIMQRIPSFAKKGEDPLESVRTLKDFTDKWPPPNYRPIKD